MVEIAHFKKFSWENQMQNFKISILKNLEIEVCFDRKKTPIIHGLKNSKVVFVHGWTFGVVKHPQWKKASTFSLDTLDLPLSYSERMWLQNVIISADPEINFVFCSRNYKVVEVNGEELLSLTSSGTDQSEQSFNPLMGQVLNQCCINENSYNL